MAHLFPADRAETKTVNKLVDAVYVLSVKTFAQRIAHIETEMKKHGITFSFMFEHDAAELDDALVADIFGPSDMRKAHQSLVLKNIQVWRDAVAHGYRRILVFEDDAVLAPDFAARLEQALDADDLLSECWLIFLGGMDTKVPDAYFLSPSLWWNYPLLQPRVMFPISALFAAAWSGLSIIK